MMEDSLQDQNVIFYNYENDRKINKFDLVQENEKLSDKGIYLANYTYIHSGLNLNDKFEFELKNKKYSYNIDGVIEEMQYGNYSSSVIAEYLSKIFSISIVLQKPYFFTFLSTIFIYLSTLELKGINHKISLSLIVK